MLCFLQLMVWFICSEALPLVWPPPKVLKVSGHSRSVHPEMHIVAAMPGNAILDDGILRYSAALRHYLPHDGVVDATATRDGVIALRSMHVSVDYPTENQVSMHTDESYELIVSAGNDTAQLTARTAFGALYGMESFIQLLSAGPKGRLVASSINITDAPDYSWRGVMIDAGRRFWPVDLVKSTLDTMAAVKLNVLHFHLSDHCRWAVESKLYPQLTAGLVGNYSGHYTQDDIKDLIAYAKGRAIRIVPEFDLPAHARGLLPLDLATHKDPAGRGFDFCRNASQDAPSHYMHRDQIYNNVSNNHTLTTLHSLLGEMAELFDDPVMHIGSDETFVAGPCNKETTSALQRSLCTVITDSFRKTPAGWEELLFDTKGASPNAIIQAWGGSYSPANITALGHRALNSLASHLYFGGLSNGSATWARAHVDISLGVPRAQRELLLGGEMAIWTDAWCPTLQCHAFEGPVQKASVMFSPAHDVAFGKSIAGLMWPFGYVGASSFWHYDASIDARSQEFETAMYTLNDKLAARGSLVCPSRCQCDFLSGCGKPYVSNMTSSVELIV